jgi:hypothetical protein
MDPLSATASIITVLQLSTKVLAYLNDVKTATKYRAQCVAEISNLHNRLLSLRFWLEEGGSEPWTTAVRALAVKNGPLDQFKQDLETLQTKMTDGGRLRNVSELLIWKFKNEEIVRIFHRTEHLNSLVETALEMDRW